MKLERLFFLVVAISFFSIVMYRAMTVQLDAEEGESSNVVTAKGQSIEKSPKKIVRKLPYKSEGEVLKTCQQDHPDDVKGCVKYMLENMESKQEAQRTFPYRPDHEIEEECKKTNPADVSGCVAYVKQRMLPKGVAKAKVRVFPKRSLPEIQAECRRTAPEDVDGCVKFVLDHTEK